MDWAWRQALARHGWKQSQCTGGWFRRHEKRRAEFVGGDYIPRYAREVRRLRRLGSLPNAENQAQCYRDVVLHAVEDNSGSEVR